MNKLKVPSIPIIGAIIFSGTGVFILIFFGIQKHFMMGVVF